MSDITWQEPPTPAVERGKWTRIGGELRKRPHAWALVVADKPNNSGMTGIKRALGDGFEVVTRKNEHGLTDTYARFIGGESA